MDTVELKLQLPGPLYQRLEQTAHLVNSEVQKVIRAMLETALPPLPADLPPEVAADLTHWTWLNDTALCAIADAFLPPKQRRRYTILLRRREEKHLSAREEAEWEALEDQYRRFSENKAKARVLLDQRRKSRRLPGDSG